MQQSLTAKSTIIINAPIEKVWQTITDPIAIKQFMMGMEAVSSWKEGEELRWIGRHEENPEDNAKGTIITLKPAEKLAYSFYYPGYGYPDQQDYYNTITYDLEPKAGQTQITVQQGDFSVFEKGEVFMAHSQQFWDQVLKNLKELAEK